MQIEFKFKDREADSAYAYWEEDMISTETLEANMVSFYW